jgi:hypothetical protein
MNRALRQANGMRIVSLGTALGRGWSEVVGAEGFRLSGSADRQPDRMESAMAEEPDESTAGRSDGTSETEPDRSRNAMSGAWLDGAADDPGASMIERSGGCGESKQD